MAVRHLIFASLALACMSVFAQADLPARMKGMFKTQSGRTGDATIELVKMESPEQARIKVNLTGTTNAHGMACGFRAVETDAKKDNGAWTFSFPSQYCDSKWTMTIKPIDGRQRFEGTFTTDFPSAGTVYYEW